MDSCIGQGRVAALARSDDATAAPPGDAADDDPNAVAQTPREIARAVHKATLDALESGQPTHWHKDGLEGDIAVSEAQDEGQDQTCRTVTGTIGTADGDSRQSGDHVWCQSDDGGDWKPQ